MQDKSFAGQGSARSRRWSREARWGIGVAGAVLGLLFALAGCGSSSSLSANATKITTVATVPPVSPVTRGSKKPASRRFLQEVNDVCLAVRRGAPEPPAGEARPAALVRYSTAARPVTQRTIISLQRLAAQGATDSLRTVISGYQQLQGAYAVGAVDAHAHADAARQEAMMITQREQAITTASRTGGIPACGVAGR